MATIKTDWIPGDLFNTEDWTRIKENINQLCVIYSHPQIGLPTYSAGTVCAQSMRVAMANIAGFVAASMGLSFNVSPFKAAWFDNNELNMIESLYAIHNDRPLFYGQGTVYGEGAVYGGGYFG